MDLVTAIRTYSGIKIPNNLDADAYLRTGAQLSGSWILGTGIIYEAPGEKFKREVRSDGLVFQVPSKYLGKKDVALVFQSGFKIDTKTSLYTGEVTYAIENFPSFNGLYAVHKPTGIPQGKKLNEVLSDDENARRLHRREDSGYIGAVVRGSNSEFRRSKTVYMDYYPVEGALYVALFEPLELDDQPAAKPPEWLVSLHRDAAEAQSALSGIEPNTSPELIKPILKLIRNAASLEIKE